MSDLAPFIAAVTNDETVLRLMEENKRLREVVEQYRANAVEITGSGGFPFHSRSQLDEDGRYDLEREMWCVTLAHHCDLNLKDLNEVEIHRAGSVTRLTDLEECWGFLENDHGHDVVLLAGEGVDQIELCFRIEGLSEELWLSLVRSRGKIFVDILLNGCGHTSAKISFQYIMVVRSKHM